jgi:anti-anti-sigma regulatory factor
MTSKNKSPHPAVLAFAGRLTVERSTELKRSFLEALEGADLVTLDLSGATEVDITFFQLLFAAHRAALDAGKSLVLPPGHPPAVIAALEGAGLCVHAGLCANSGEQCLWSGVTR